MDRNYDYDKDYGYDEDYYRRLNDSSYDYDDDDDDNYYGDSYYYGDYVDYDDLEVDRQDLEAVAGHFYETNNPAYGSDLFDDVTNDYEYSFDDDVNRYYAQPFIKDLENVNSVLDLYIISNGTTIFMQDSHDYGWLLEAYEQIKKKSKVIV